MAGARFIIARTAKDFSRFSSTDYNREECS
jgi:hypothetical protein